MHSHWIATASLKKLFLIPLLVYQRYMREIFFSFRSNDISIFTGRAIFSFIFLLKCNCKKKVVKHIWKWWLQSDGNEKKKISGKKNVIVKTWYISTQMKRHPSEVCYIFLCTNKKVCFSFLRLLLFIADVSVHHDFNCSEAWMQTMSIWIWCKKKTHYFHFCRNLHSHFF